MIDAVVDLEEGRLELVDCGVGLEVLVIIDDVHDEHLTGTGGRHLQADGNMALVLAGAVARGEVEVEGVHKRTLDRHWRSVTCRPTPHWQTGTCRPTAKWLWSSWAWWHWAK